MALQQITNGITGQQAADIIYDNDLELQGRIEALEDVALPVETEESNPNLFDRDNAYMDGTGDNKAIDPDGNIGTFAGYKLSYPIAVQPQVALTLAGLPAKPYGIQYQNAGGSKIGSDVPAVFPFTFIPPAGCTRLQFTCKDATDTDIPPATLRLAGVAVGDIVQATGGNFIKADLLSDNAKIRGDKVMNETDTLALLKQASRGVNLFNKNGANIAGYAVGATGNIEAFAGYILSEPIAVSPLTAYELDSDQPPVDVKGIQFQNAAGTKVGFVIAGTTYPFKFTTPAGCTRLQFTCKSAVESDMPDMYLGTAATGEVYPFAGADIVAYGDSITMDYPEYADWLKTKLKVTNVTRRGQSGQSFTGLLQSDAVLNTMVTAVTPASVKLLVIHSVNDFRTNAVLGTVADVAGTASFYGGLKKIMDAAIAANPAINIILCTPLISGASSPYPAFNQPNSIGLYGSDYAAAVRVIASLYGGRLCDLSAKCQFRPSVETGSGRIYTLDTVHPNSKGYDRMTTLIADEANAINI